MTNAPDSVRIAGSVALLWVLSPMPPDDGQVQHAAALGDQPTPERTPVDGERLGAAVRAHLQRYFDLHGRMLPPPGLYARVLREIELPMIELALDATRGNQARCAELLGINRNTLRKKITDLDIRVTRRRKLM